MKVPLSWLREFVMVTVAPQTLADRLTMAGIEVEELIDRKKTYDQVVVGEIVHIRPHPNADTLRLAFVVVGKSGQPLEIVCGAPNIAVGQKVAVALLGARLPNGMTIESRRIRGVASHGMICAEDELGLGPTHEGTMELDPALKVGTPLAKAMGLDDVTLDLTVPTNRGDLLSVRGLAREVAAILGTKLSIKSPVLKESFASRSVKVAVASAKLCPVYTARVVHGIVVKPSPEWLQRRLRLAGIRPINAVVDATNYIMLEYGQPLHAFDASTLQGRAMAVRTAWPGEQMTTLDGVRRTLDPSMLVIADEKGPIALAGVMGAAHTEISNTTSDVILESAIFDPASVRRTALKLGLRSEASHRFERGLPLSLPEQASRAAAALIVKLGGGEVEKGSVVTGRRSPAPTVVTVKPAQFSEALGMKVLPARARRALTRLGFMVRGASSWKVTVPFWRLDVRLPEDLVEEIGRMEGYQHLPEVLPYMEFVPKPLPQLVKLKDDIRDLLVGFGFSETITHAYYGTPWKDEIGGDHFEIANPLDRAQQYLRKSIVPQLRSILLYSVAAGQDANVFQIGRVFTPVVGKPVTEQQPWKLAIGMAFKPAPGYCRGRKITGILDELFAALGVLGAGISRSKLEIGSNIVKGRVLEWCELDVSSMRDNFAPFSFTPLPKYPAVHRDVSFWVPETLKYRDIERTVVEAARPLGESMELFDVYEKSGRRSYALRVTFRSPERTLTEAEISAKLKAITAALRHLGAELR